MKNWTKEFPKKIGWYWMVINDDDPVPVKIEQHPLFLRPNDPVSLIITSFNGKSVGRKNIRNSYFLPLDKVMPPLKGKEFDMSATKKSSLINLARAAWNAADEYRLGFSDYYDKLELLPLDSFWKLVDSLVGEILYALKDNRSVKNGIEEFYRRALAKDFLRGTTHIDPYTIEQALRVGNQLEKTTNAIYDLLGVQEVDEDFWGDYHCSDDTLGDLCDVLPLAGRTIVENLLAGKYESFNELKEKMYMDCFENKTFKKYDGYGYTKVYWSDYILKGEFYICMTLRDKGRYFYQSSVLRD